RRRCTEAATSAAGRSVDGRVPVHGITFGRIAAVGLSGLASVGAVVRGLQAIASGAAVRWLQCSSA
ncbi:MAG TPA: hypothetical protein VGV93_14005, partial [Acidimicrobiales bacterium]|nr:hypothetical protein [Acidimicrobiales bacterium]